MLCDHLTFVRLEFLNAVGSSPVAVEAVQFVKRNAPSKLASLVVWFALVFAVGHTVCADTPSYETDVLPILKAKCFQCHGKKVQKGDVRFDTLSNDLVHDRAAMETWHDALTAIQLGEMPPEEAKSLDDTQRRILVTWIRENVDRALQAVQQTSDGVVLRRLNNAEYAYTMTELLGLEMDYSVDLPPDPLSHNGFKNDGAALGMSALQLESYLNTARSALSLVLLDGQQPASESFTLQPQNKFKLKQAQGDNTTRLGRVHYWAGQVNQLPRTGKFKIRVTAHAESVDGMPAPIMQVKYGYFVAGLTTQFIQTMDEVAVSNEQPTTFDFVGQAELFPMPESSVPSEKVNAVIAITNVLNDAKPMPKAVTTTTGKKKRKRTKVYPEDPEFPKVVIDSIEFITQAYDSWPPKTHQQILPSSINLSAATVRDVLKPFLQRAWRRPVTKVELERWVKHYNLIRLDTATPIEALRETLAASLTSPPFLYLVEPRTDGGKTASLTSHQVASRLSYFLWSSTPDEPLSELADANKLLDDEVLSNEVRRMLSDKRVDRFIDQFATQWLDLESLQRVAVNPQYYRGFDDSLKRDMVAETKEFFAEVLRKDLSALSFLDSNFTMLNAALAKHYGISGPRSQKFERVSLVGRRPGGLLGQASMHMAGSDGVDSHPIKRAVWIRERLLHDPPKPPPPDVPGIESNVQDFKKLTVREQLEAHRSKAACADCHQSIDPWGIALEHYDAIGLYRDKIARKNKPVDSNTVLPGNHEVRGIKDLQNYLVQHRSGQFADALVSKLFSYALGRELVLADQPTVDELSKQFADSNYKLSELMRAIITHPDFRSR